MMNRTVIKYGGSNLKDPQSLPLLKQIILGHSEPPVIVVSALSGITDLILEKLHRIPADKLEQGSLIRSLEVRHREFILSVIQEKEPREHAIRQLQERLGELSRYLQAAYLVGEVPPFLYDLITSYGEKLSSLLITLYLQHTGIDCLEVLPCRMPLVTDGEFGQAEVDIEASVPGVTHSLPAGKVCVVPGFYGVSKEGRVTLLGRGGSDYSAACIARCIGAASLDLWKNVEGFLSGDPGHVPDPFRIERLTYAEAAELAYFGAKILHPRTIDPLFKKNIPIRIFSVKNMSPDPVPLTLINGAPVQTIPVIKSIAFSDEFAILTMKGTGLGFKPGILARITTILRQNRINISSVVTSQIAINFLLSGKDSSRALSLISDLKIPEIAEILMNRDISVVAVVGVGLLREPGIAARIFGALASQRINVSLSSFGASDVVAYLVVDRKSRAQAVQLIHNELFSQKNNQNNDENKKIPF